MKRIASLFGLILTLPLVAAGALNTAQDDDEMKPKLLSQLCCWSIINRLVTPHSAHLLLCLCPPQIGRAERVGVTMQQAPAGPHQL